MTKKRRGLLVTLGAIGLLLLPVHIARLASASNTDAVTVLAIVASLVAIAAAAVALSRKDAS